MTQRTDASLLTDMSLFIGDMEDFISEHPEVRQNIKQDPSGVFLSNRIRGIADSASHLSPKTRLALPSQPMRWVAETAEITARHDMWHKIDQKGYRHFIDEGMKLCREAVDKTLAELPRI